jgi:hypothetical protein
MKIVMAENTEYPQQKAKLTAFLVRLIDSPPEASQHFPDPIGVIME